MAYGLRIDGLQFKEIDFSDTTPEFKNIILRPVDENNCKYEILIKKNICSSADVHLRAIFNEASMEAEKFRYVFSRAANIKVFDFECLGYYYHGNFRHIAASSVVVLCFHAMQLRQY